MTKVAVVVVTYNGESWIEQCLGSVFAQDCDPIAIVVDNASTDQTVAIVESRFPQARLVRNLKNDGFGIGNNIGISAALKAGAEYVLLLNQDAYIPKQELSALVTFLDNSPEFGVASPLQCSPDSDSIDRRTYIGYLAPHAREWLCDSALGKAKAAYAVYGMNAASWLVRSSVFAKVGGFDPIFFMYGEDDDLLDRFRHHGVAFALVPGARMVHLRKSPPAPHLSGRQKISALARRQQSAVIRSTKVIGWSIYFRAWNLLRHGFIEPALDFVSNRNVELLLASWLAGVQTLFLMRRIHQHAKRTAVVGPHFLS